MRGQRAGRPAKAQEQAQAPQGLGKACLNARQGGKVFQPGGGQPIHKGCQQKEAKNRQIPEHHWASAGQSGIGKEPGMGSG